ncbi:hypothetical protein J7438_15745 [Thalassotalea sp. G20_0]|uniref:hypothetical protein n=1 Tax=Thalassotalea sp. G20_0 TaxID=2821093 RepID=UPI001ADC22FE|nr:hypothetical protein [Thalassotalea sp. G20_0]MBO9495530.1 hypothetical protein [Thalassotalea sp. G20_0]
MRAMAASAGTRMEGDACCFERGFPYRSVRPVYSGGYFSEGFTGQQNYGGSQYTEQMFSGMVDHMSDISSPMSVLSHEEIQEKTTTGRFSDDRAFLDPSYPYRAQRQMPDQYSPRQPFERYETPIAGTDFPGNNSEQRTPPTVNDMDCHNPPESTTADSCTLEQEYFQRLATLREYKDLIEEVKEFLPKTALDGYIQDFLSGNRKELELSRLFKQNPTPRPLCGVISSSSDHISSKKARKAKKAKKAHRIMDNQKKELRTILESQKPSDFAINARKWTIMNVTKLINNLFQLDFEQGSAKNLLCRMKISLKSINDSHKLTLGR